MTTIVTRAGKGSPLTNNEVDANFVNLNTDKVEIGGDLSGTATSPTVSKIQNRAVSATAPADGDAYIWDVATSTWVPGPAGGSGTITGPTSSTDNALVRWDGTTGTAIKNSNATVDSAGVLSTPGVVTAYTQIDTTAPSPTILAGTLAWNDYSGTVELGLKGGNTRIELGQEVVARVYNNSGVVLSRGQVVYIDGAQINRVSVKLARANLELTSAGTLGLVSESIAVGAEGFITLMGQLNNLDTSGFTSGGAVYLSPTVEGGLTQTKPVAPNHMVIVGWVERVDATTGSIYIKVDNGYELDELHDVRIVSKTGGQIISYDQTNGYWKNTNLAAGTGVTVNSDIGGVITVTNTAPDQTVVLNNGAGISISGTYPDFTVTNTAPSSGGTVTSIIAGTGLSGGTITSSGTIALDNTAVTAGSYGAASKTLTATVNAQGQLTALTDTDISVTLSQVSDAGTIASQDANDVAITGGSITNLTTFDGITIDGGTF